MQSSLVTENPPKQLLYRRLSECLESRKGNVGISDLVEKISSYWPDLTESWSEGQEKQDLECFGKNLFYMACATDSDDLVCSELPLRKVGETGDSFVWSKFFIVILDVFTDKDSLTAIEVIKQLLALDLESILFASLQLTLVQIYMENKDYLRAAEIARESLKDQFLGSEYLLLECTKKLKESESSHIKKDSIDLTSYFCSQPFDTLSTANRRTGGTPLFFACGCATHQPYPVGDGSKQFEDVWNGEKIQEIRRSILDGDFKYCSRMSCPYIYQGTLPKRDQVEDPYLKDVIENKITELKSRPSKFSFGHDQSCNLGCPSCRKDIKIVSRKEQDELNQFAQKTLLPVLKDSSKEILFTTDGDTFASQHYKYLLECLKDESYSKLNLRILTNGILLTKKQWGLLGPIQKMIRSVTVSIDGARKETYERLRYPAKWELLLENMQFLGTLRRESKLEQFYLHYVVQEENFKEMVEFVDLGLSWNVDWIWFIPLLNTQSYERDDYAKRNIFDSEHPRHNELVEIMQHPNLQLPNVKLLSQNPNERQAQDRQENSSWFGSLLKILKQK